MVGRRRVRGPVISGGGAVLLVILLLLLGPRLLAGTLGLFRSPGPNLAVPCQAPGCVLLTRDNDNKMVSVHSGARIVVHLIGLSGNASLQNSNPRVLVQTSSGVVSGTGGTANLWEFAAVGTGSAELHTANTESAGTFHVTVQVTP